MTPPPMTVLAGEMVSLLFLLVQGGKQENQLIKVKEVPHKPMRRLQTRLKAGLWQPQEKQKQAVLFKKLSVHSGLIMSTP
jgi:hypothetical protein